MTTVALDPLALADLSDGAVEDLRATLRAKAQASLYFFCTAILNYNKLTPQPHRPLCDFVQIERPSRKLVLIPRDCFKSTVAAKALPLWILIQDTFLGLPGREHRILIGSFSAVNAQKSVRAIKHQVQQNELLQWLFPEIIPPNVHETTWTDSNLLFPREGVYGEDTIECAGVDTHLVSRHYTVQIHDDLEDEKAAESPTVRARVKNWYRASEALFVSERDACHLLVGTRWGLDDLYSEIIANEGDVYARFIRPLHWTRADLEQDRKRVAIKEPPLYDMDPDIYAPDPGATYYLAPEIFPADSCRRLQKKQGTWLYSMLYLNNPKDPALAEFKPSDIQAFYFGPQSGDLQLLDSDGRTVIEEVPFDSLKRVLFWDPALTDSEQKAGCRNAMVVLAQDRHGRLFVLDAWAEKKNPAFLFKKFIGLYQRWRCHSAAIEDIGFQRQLKFPLYHEMRTLGVNFPVQALRPTGSKPARIRSLIPYAEARHLFVRRGLQDFLAELYGFPAFPTVDLIDAAAGCLELVGRPVMVDGQSDWKAARRESLRLATRSVVTGY